MALKLFRRKAKAAKEEVVEEVKAAVLPILEDKIPDELVKVEKIAAAITDKQETIEEENEASTVESVADEPVQEEGENSDPASTDKNDDSEVATKEVETTEESKEQSSSAGTFACCQGSSADVLKNLQAAVGMA